MSRNPHESVQQVSAPGQPITTPGQPQNMGIQPQNINFQVVPSEPFVEKISKLQLEVVRLERERDNLLQIISSVTIEKERLNNIVAELQEKNSVLEKQNEKMQEQISKLELEVRNLASEVHNLKTTLASRQLALDVEKYIIENLLKNHQLLDYYCDHEFSVRAFLKDYEETKKQSDDKIKRQYDDAWVELDKIATDANFISRKPWSNAPKEFKEVLRLTKKDGNDLAHDQSRKFLQSMTSEERSKLKCDRRLIQLYEKHLVRK